MRVLKWIGIGLLVVVAAVAGFLVVSTAVDALMGGDRVATLTNTSIDSGDGPTLRAFVAAPAEDGPHPAVIMLHEFYGLRPDVTEKAAALAEEGYVVVAPDMYRGQTTGWIPRAIYLALSIPEAQVLADLDPVYAWLAAQPNVDPERIVVMGFCYGGGKALQYSLRNPALAGTGVFYGALVDDPAVLATLPGPVLGIFGREDQAPSPAMVEGFAAGLDAAGVPATIRIFDGVGHAFVGDMATIAAGGAPGEAWALFLQWLGETVG